MELVSKELGLAKRDEAPVLARMSRDYIEQGLNWRWRTPAILNMIRNPEAVVLCARCRRTGADATGLPPGSAGGRHGTADGRWRGTVIGGFGIMQYAMERAHLNLLAVHPSLRRHGLASDLLAWLEETASPATPASTSRCAPATPAAAPSTGPAATRKRTSSRVTTAASRPPSGCTNGCVRKALKL